jgi:hypothetical protein
VVDDVVEAERLGDAEEDLETRDESDAVVHIDSVTVTIDVRVLAGDCVARAVAVGELELRAVPVTPSLALPLTLGLDVNVRVRDTRDVLETEPVIREEKLKAELLDALGLTERDFCRDVEGRAVPVILVDPLTDVEIEADRDPPRRPAPLDGDRLGDAEALFEFERLPVDVAEAEVVAVAGELGEEGGIRDCVAPDVSDAIGVPLVYGEAVAVEQEENFAEYDCVREPVNEIAGDRDNFPDEETDGDPETEGVGPGLRLALRLALAERDVTLLAVADGERLLDAVADEHRDPLLDGALVGSGVPDVECDLLLPRVPDPLDV